MIYTLENSTAIISVDTRNCEIASFRRKDKDIEYMWNGDPKYWSGRNPTLFPHVSSPKNKILNFKGKDYKVNNHGFCRKSEFAFVEQGDDYLLFSLKDNEQTLKEYPYHFEMLVRYTLKDNRIYIDYTIKNNDEDDLYFGFGQHPAFNCPLVKDKEFADYWVEFEKEDVEKDPAEDLKEVPEAPEFALKDGDRLEFICDYYSYSGEYQDSYLLGEPTVIDGEPVIEYLRPSGGSLRLMYKFTDLYENEFWTPALVQ